MSGSDHERITAMAAPEAIEHPKPAERAAKGRAARATVPRTSHAGWDAPADRMSPVEVLKEQAKTRVRRAHPDPARPHDGVTVRVLPRRGGGHGGRPRDDAELGHHGPVLR